MVVFSFQITNSFPLHFAILCSNRLSRETDNHSMLLLDSSSRVPFLRACKHMGGCFFSREEVSVSSRNSPLLSVLFAAFIQLCWCASAQAQQPALFVAGALGVGSSGTVQKFDLPASQDEQGTKIATLLGFVEAVTCGPDGNLYVSLSGYGCCSPARQIWRISLDGTNPNQNPGL
jgi:hypothetical protein